MKKILVVLMIALTSTVLAENSSTYKVFSKLSDESVSSKVMNYIDADSEQIRFLQHVFRVTGEEMKTAIENNSEKVAENVMNYNLRNVKCILSEEQYSNYLVFLNVYLNEENGLPLFADIK